MARKNSSVRGAKGRAGRYAAENGNDINGYPSYRVNVEDIVMPEGQCYFQTKKPKARFSTSAKAEKALAQAILTRARTGSAHVEKRYYKCPEGGCGGWHLTSRESFDEDAWSRRRNPEAI